MLRFWHVDVARLTYPHHCCAFRHPEKQKPDHFYDHQRNHGWKDWMTKPGAQVCPKWEGIVEGGISPDITIPELSTATDPSMQKNERDPVTYKSSPMMNLSEWQYLSTSGQLLSDIRAVPLETAFHQVMAYLINTFLSHICYSKPILWFCVSFCILTACNSMFVVLAFCMFF